MLRETMWVIAHSSDGPLCPRSVCVSALTRSCSCPSALTHMHMCVPIFPHGFLTSYFTNRRDLWAEVALNKHQWRLQRNNSHTHLVMQINPFMSFTNRILLWHHWKSRLWGQTLHEDSAGCNRWISFRSLLLPAESVEGLWRWNCRTMHTAA